MVGAKPATVTDDQVTRWRSLVEGIVATVWPELPQGPLWILSQLAQESAGDPRALSHEGARGLMQLMPDTARKDLGLEVSLNRDERVVPARCVWAGVTYLRRQYDHLAEIPRDPDRLYWAFASYNGGRGFVNRALSIARGRGNPAPWWSWAAACDVLFDPECTIGGKRPDAAQITGYVAAILRNYSALVAIGG